MPHPMPSTRDGIDPGSTIGILGGGQLARMLCMEAKRMGYRTLVWTGGQEAPATALCDEVIVEPFDDPTALARFVASADVATVEFENIPPPTLDAVCEALPLRPNAHAIRTCANREAEKAFLRAQGIPCAPFWVVSSATELSAAMQELRGPGVLKTSAFGYDGKGQRKLTGNEDATQVWSEFATPRAILEGFILFERELSIMIARTSHGEVRCYDPVENHHRHHILDVTIAPAYLAPDLIRQARDIATRIAVAFDYVGILGVEFFLDPIHGILVNEMAPRPHNSGHHTIDACITSQFEQQLRAVCDLPLGSTRLLSPCVMLNLLGDMWKDENQAPDWTTILADDAASLHLYGKKRAIQRRKMGHVTFFGDDALNRAYAIRDQLLQFGQKID